MVILDIFYDNLPWAMSSGIKGVVSKIQTGSINARTLIDSTLEQCRKHRDLNAFNFLRSSSELQKYLSQLQNGTRVSMPLLGIPVAVKDNFCVQGMPSTCSSKMLHNFKPPYTATVVEKLMDAGALVIGKTNMDEFGMGNGTTDSIFGPTRNVWGLRELRENRLGDWYVPGGSSGGSAVAVAAGICFAALGSDTGGSTRNPASYCGVVGLKPTYGLLSRHGLIPLVNSMDVPGIITRTVEDCALVFNLVKGFDPKDPTSVNDTRAGKPVEIQDEPCIDNVSIGIPGEFHTPLLSPEVIKCWQDVTELLRSGGASINEVSLPNTKYSIACYSVLNPCEVASNMARYDGLRYGHRTAKITSQKSTEAMYAETRHEGFNDVVRGRILAGNFFLLKQSYDKYFSQALKIRRLITEDYKKVWARGVQLLLTPVTLTTAPAYSDFIQWDNRKQSSVQDYCTQSANLAGLPAVSIPIKLSASGLPLSLQLIGPEFSEELMLNVARFIENSVQFKHLHAEYSI